MSTKFTHYCLLILYTSQCPYPRHRPLPQLRVCSRNGKHGEEQHWQAE
jgi:hypothetical protein